MAGQSITFDFLTTGADRTASGFKKVGDNTLLAAKGAKVLQDTFDKLGSKENRTAAESQLLAKALRETGVAEDRVAARAVLADASIRRLGDAMKDASKNTGSARAGFAGLVGEVTGFGAASTAASSKSSMFARALAGINLASGVLEPALAGVVVAVGGLAAGLTAAAAGLGAFGLVAKANFAAASTAATQATTAQDAHKAAVAKVTGQYQYAMSVAKTRAQKQAAYAAEQKGFNTAELAQTAALNKAYAGLTPAQVGMAKQISGMKTQWQSFTAGFAPMLNQMLTTAAPVFKIILGDIGKLARAGGTAIQALLPSLGVAIGSSGFQKFIDMLAKNTGPAIVKIGVAIGNVVVGIGGILKAFMPMSQSMLSGIGKITAKFREWGTTLSSHTGFQSLMTTFRTETPQAVAILKNLGVVLGNVGKAMFGLSSFSNSKMLLNMLLPLSGAMASLSKNTTLVRLALYGLLAVKIGQQFSWVGGAAHSLVLFSGAAKGATVAQIIAAAATRAWGLAMMALPWVAIAAAVIALAVVIIKYHSQIWAFVRRIWNDVVGFIKGSWNKIFENSAGMMIRLGHNVLTQFNSIRHGIAVTFDGIRHNIANAWNVVYGNTIGALIRLGAGIRDKFTSSKNWIVSNFINPVRNLFTQTLPNAFRTAVTNIAGAWNRIKEAVAGPVRWVANNVINPLFGFINRITNFVGLGKPLPGVHMAAGGQVPGQGRGDTVPAMLTPGEVVVPVRMVAAGAVDHLRGQLPGFAAGGQVPGGTAETARLWSIVRSSGIPSLSLTSGFRPGGSSAHAFGDAIDVGSYDTGSTNPNTPMNALARWLTAHYHNSYEIIHNPWGSVKQGRDVPASYWGAATWAQHLNHVHWAENYPGFKGSTTGGGLAGFGPVGRTLAQIFSGLGNMAKIAIDLAHGDAGGAGRALAALIPKSAGGAGGALAQTLLRLPGTLIGKVMHFLVAKVKGFASSQQGAGVPGGNGPVSAGAAAAQKYAQSRLGAFGWAASQILPLVALWNGESGWNRLARNPSSGAYGIPQALPASKMGAAANPPTSSAAAQIDWGMNYIRSVYGSPAGAYGKWQARSPHWYGSGTPSAAPGLAVVGERGPELVRFRGGEQVIPGYAAGGFIGGNLGQQGSAYLNAWRNRRGGGFGAAWGPVVLNQQIEAMTAAIGKATTLAGARGLTAAQHKHWAYVAAQDKKRLATLTHELGVERKWRTALTASDTQLTSWIRAAGTTPSLRRNVTSWKAQLGRQETAITRISAMLGWSKAHIAADVAAGRLGPGGKPLPGITHTYGGDVANTTGAFLAAALGPFTGTATTFDRGGWLRPGLNPPMYNATGRPELLVPARGGGGTVRLEVSSGGSTEFDRFMESWLRKHVKVKGGGDVQRALGAR